VVRLTDVMPTVLALSGMASPKTDGVNLVDVIRGRAPELDAYSESHYPIQLGWSPLRALRDGRFKLIDAPRPELYDLQRDPNETTDIYRERPALARAMQQRLDTLSRPTGETVDAAPSPVDPAVHERLAALGYVMRLGRPTIDSTVRPPDPKDCIDTFDEQDPTRPIARKRPKAGC